MRASLLILLGLLVLAGGGATLLHERSHPAAALHLLDVGQGDAILLQSGSTDVLVDGGPDAAVLRRLGDVRPAWDRRLEVVVLTHPQQDHLAGLLPALERERVGLLLLPRLAAESGLFRAFVADLLARGMPVRFAVAGQRITAGELTITVLGPNPRTLALGRQNPNNGAVVLRVDAGNVPLRRARLPGGQGFAGQAFSALLTGDIERAAEHELVRQWGSALDTDVLKVAHHGSKTSTTVRLLRAATPSLALISVGPGNRYGHPHASVLGRLRDVPVLRTDAHGTVSIAARGGRTVLVCARGCGDLVRR